MATIRDVARRAGVSAASVSRVLKNDTTFSVSQKTRERILEAAGELGYNKCFEYSAIQGTRGTIGVMLLYGEEEEVEDKFYQIIRVNIKMELEKNGFKVKEVFESMLDANASKISIPSARMILRAVNACRPTSVNPAKLTNNPRVHSGRSLTLP